MKTTRLLVVDDHAIVRKGIRMIVNTEPSVEIVGETGDGKEAIHLTKSLCPDVILMDLVMSGIGGVEAIAEIKQSVPEVKIIVLTTFGDKIRVNAAIEAGADGYLLKDEDDGNALLAAIQQVRHGHLPIHPQVTRHLLGDPTPFQDTNGPQYLTEREKEVLELLTKGLSNKDMAQVLNLTKGTVKVHVSRILHKLQATSRTEAVVYALGKGLVARDNVGFLLLYIPFGIYHLFP